jgi:hypothetical protein
MKLFPSELVLLDRILKQLIDYGKVTSLSDMDKLDLSLILKSVEYDLQK